MSRSPLRHGKGEMAKIVISKWKIEMKWYMERLVKISIVRDIKKAEQGLRKLFFWKVTYL